MLNSVRIFKNPVNSRLFGSITIRFKSASSAFFNANLMPFFSISFLDFRIPAVSTNLIGSPSTSRKDSSKSLVVPGIFVTIEMSFPEI